MYDHTQILAEIPSSTPGIRCYTLKYRPAQVDFYGNAVSEAWGAIFYEYSGTTNGRWFKTEAEARMKFAQWQAKEGV